MIEWPRPQKSAVGIHRGCLATYSCLPDCRTGTVVNSFSNHRASCNMSHATEVAERRIKEPSAGEGIITTPAKAFVVDIPVEEAWIRRLPVYWERLRH